MRILVSGFIAQHPRLGGVTWDYMQYLIGLRNLGHEVFYFEDSGEWHYRLPGEDPDNSALPNVNHLAAIMDRFGFTDHWAYRSAIEERWYGMGELQRKAVIDSADMLINVSGALQNPGHYRKIPRLVYIDSDPGFTQIRWTKDGGLRERLSIHDVWFTFGADLDSPLLPRTSIPWMPTQSPILLDEWSPCTSTRNVWTTVMSWTSYRPIEYGGRQFGQKDMEFQRFIGLPGRVPGIPLEISMHLHRHEDWESSNDVTDPLTLLVENGWNLTDSQAVAFDIDSYRQYVRTSFAEWSVAKHAYVTTKTGWFSCRSSCYLAAARPVVLEDTGFSETIPTGRGILTFHSEDEAEDCIRRVQARPDLHCKAARELAREYFAADRVLSSLIDRATVCRVQHASTGAE